MAAFVHKIIWVNELKIKFEPNAKVKELLAKLKEKLSAYRGMR